MILQDSLAFMAYGAGEPWSANPVCCCPVISMLLRTWNDRLSTDDRRVLLRPLIALGNGIRGNSTLQRRRSMMLEDWFVREHAPAWLRLVGLAAPAAALAGLPELISPACCASALDAVVLAQASAAAARDAAIAKAVELCAGGSADVGQDVACDTAQDVAAEVVNDTWLNDGARAVWAAAWVTPAVRCKAARTAVIAVRRIAWNTANVAAYAWVVGRGHPVTARQAQVAAVAALEPTRIAVQQSTLALVHRMIKARKHAS